MTSPHASSTSQTGRLRKQRRDVDHDLQATTAETLAVIEYRALRQELIMRMVVQNVLMVLQPLLLLGCYGLALMRPLQASPTALLFLFVSLAASAQWCHMGVRTVHLKTFLMQSEERLGAERTWETFLPGARPKSLLGSRWLISTKGVFLLVQGLAIMIPSALDQAPPAWFLAVAISVLGASQWLLLTNPKE